MRIGIFTDTYVPFINGVTTSVLMLKDALEKKGHDVFIVTVNNEDMHYKYEENDRIIIRNKEVLVWIMKLIKLQ